MRRTYNYTGRKRILRDQIQITLKRKQEIIESFEASIRLEGMELPDDAPVYIEAYHRTELERYKFGTVRNPVSEGETKLSRLAYRENLRFRILVINEHERFGIILASADKISPIVEGLDELHRRTILPVNWVDLGLQIWRIVYENDLPILQINKNIPDIRRLATSDVRFFFHVYPAVIRELLKHMVFIDRIDDADDPAEEWHKDWIRFAKRYASNDRLSELLNPDEGKFDQSDQRDIMTWIDEVIAEFCNSHNDKWQRYLRLEEGS